MGKTKSGVFIPSRSHFVLHFYLHLISSSVVMLSSLSLIANLVSFRASGKLFSSLSLALYTNSLRETFCDVLNVEVGQVPFLKDRFQPFY